ncbi:MAG: hypothetical protein VCD00_06255 [Candidatus Hydrogenedentota bacterium]
MKRVIFVDDDVNIGQAMKRMLRPMRNEWEMVFCSSGEEALAVLEEQGAFAHHHIRHAHAGYARA